MRQAKQNLSFKQSKIFNASQLDEESDMLIADNEDHPAKLEFVVEGIHVKWPKPTIFETQARMVKAIILACKYNVNAMIESPTGTGKTLGLLIPALAYLQAEMTEMARSWKF